ncbi:hypothetical protein PRIPAC_80102 [Pristionchus pacificus]|uniref:Uncharacterized protein n=1 Tax=Pristionchus pacificus TaxID=54126 RepID=A0A2A6CPN1_PRIPA|nr:hypothetical protein PRIPAC_80102 [Pristionchus pacificus]|eukprot:PDM80099.1 hypothetical protein PRIPAC_32678 [Pristionchus pacificus]
MDFFALPDAGRSYGKGELEWTRDAEKTRTVISISIYIGDELLRIIVPSNELDKFIAHWNRLFTGLDVEDSEYYPAHGNFNSDSIRMFTEKFKIETFHSTESGIAQFERHDTIIAICKCNNSAPFN